MDKTVTEETKKSLARSFPQGDKWEKRKVIRVTMKGAWYKVGDIIEVKYFATFGCYDVKNRWVDYYDVSLPLFAEHLTSVKALNWYTRILNWIKNLFK